MKMLSGLLLSPSIARMFFKMALWTECFKVWWNQAAATLSFQMSAHTHTAAESLLSVTLPTAIRETPVLYGVSLGLL